MKRRLAVLALGAAVCTASVGLVLAQETPAAPPAGSTPAPSAAPAVGAPASPPVALGGEAPPPDEIAPPPLIANQDAEAVEPAPAPDDKKVDPLKRPRFASAILQAVDKTTAETLRFEAKVGEPVRYKGLVLTVHACEAAAPDEPVPDSFAHLDIQSQPEGLGPQPVRSVFRGWMFASAPGLHPVEHPLYDVWLIACKTAAPPAPGVNL